MAATSSLIFRRRRSRHLASALYALDGGRRVSLQTFLFFCRPRSQASKKAARFPGSLRVERCHVPSACRPDIGADTYRPGIRFVADFPGNSNGQVLAGNPFNQRHDIRRRFDGRHLDKGPQQGATATLIPCQCEIALPDDLIQGHKIPSLTKCNPHFICAGSFLFIQKNHIRRRIAVNGADNAMRLIRRFHISHLLFCQLYIKRAGSILKV